MDMVEYIKNRFGADTGFIKNNDIKIISLTKDEAVLEYEIKESGLNPQKIVHGGLIFGLADTAAGTLGCTVGKFPLTTNANINYLNKASGTKLIAKAKALKVGKNIGYYNVDIYNDKNELVANSNVNMYFIEVDLGE